MKHRLIILALFCSSFSIFSDEKIFYNFNEIYAISMKEIFSVCKDDQNFIWASSRTGILRITGNTYHDYQLPYNTADVISTKLVCENSLLIAYTNNGQLFMYDELSDYFNLFVDLRKVLNNNHIMLTNIVVDSSQSLWIASSAGLFKYGNNQLIPIDGELVNTYYITPYNESHLFIVTEQHLDLLNIHTLERKSMYKFSTDRSIHVSKLYYDRINSRLWIGTFSDGLFYYCIEKEQLYKIPIQEFPRQPVLSIAENTDSTMVFGIDGQGIWELTRDGESVLNIYTEDVDNPSSLRCDGVYDILCEDNARVWIATFGGGLSFFETESPSVKKIIHQINNPNSLGNNYINDVLEDNRNNIWLATNNGISCWNVTANRWKTFYQNKKEQAKVFLTLCEDNEGNIWAGTYSSGVYVLDGATGNELAHYSNDYQGDKLSGKFIFDIMKDCEGDIWIGGMQFITCYLSGEKKFRSYATHPVRTFMELSPGKILLACTYGLLLLDKISGNTDYLLKDFLVQDMCVVDKDIWVATSGDGLIQFNCETRTMRVFNLESGLLSNYINGILYDSGYLWIGTENGLCRLTVGDHVIQTFPSDISLSNTAFNIDAHQKLKNGNLIWGTNHGVILFNPASLYQIPVRGEIFFQDIHISGRSIRENKSLIKDIPVNKQTHLDLKYNQNNLSLELFPVGITSAGVKYSWIMEGLDPEWRQPVNYPVITYTNLPHSKFQLKIKMLDSSFSQIIDERLLSIHIKPPFWKTWWFYLLLMFVFTGLVFYFIRIYISRIKQKHAEDKVRFFTNMAHDIRTSLTLINAPIEELNKSIELTEKSRYFLDIATQQSKRLSFVATQLLDFEKVDIGKGQLFLNMTDIVILVRQRILMFETSAQKENVDLIFTSNVDSFITAIDELKTEKIVDNLVSNAVKYSHPDNRVEISLVCSHKEWCLEVKDYGLGISDKTKNKLFKEFYREDNAVNSRLVGSGIGLLLVKKYTMLHHGHVFFDCKKNQGTTFKILIPYKEVNKTPEVSKIEVKTEKIREMDFRQVHIPEVENTKGKKKWILIVEDNNGLQNFLKLSFQDYYQILTANDGAEAWNLIQKRVPHLVISDIVMPHMDGFELCQRIKSTFETAHIPVILLTALSDKTNQIEGLGLGADDYITKPFDITLLFQRIKSIVRNREIIREKALRLIDNDQPILKNDMNDQFLKKASKIVYDHIADCEFGKDKFAFAMNVSSSLLYKKMKALTGQSPSDFIKTIRLNRALELLQLQKYTVTEVSDLCGFSSINYFSRVFKGHFKKLPTDIR